MQEQQWHAQAVLQEQLRQAQSTMQEQQGQVQAALQEQLRQAQSTMQEQQGQVQAVLQEQQKQADLLANKVDTYGIRQLIYETHDHYRHVHQGILDRLKHGEKLRFASYVVYDTTFAMHGIMELMLNEPEKYDIKFVICPDIYRDKDFSQYKKTRDFFASRYGEKKILDGYDMKSGEFLDYSDKFDMVYMANPYAVLVNRIHGIYYLSRQNILPIFINYGYLGAKWSFGHLIEQPEFSLFYKVFVETEITKTEISMHSIVGGWNLVLSGHPRTDVLDKIKESSHTKKRILIAVHQSVKGIPGQEEELQWSNFLEYADFIPALADLYPDVEFVFRPHPLLFTHLVWFDLWNQDQIDSYLKLLQSKNIIYSTESEYLHLIKDCDAIIHDCGSFMMEWQYLGKPCCYVVDSEERIRGQFTKLGNFCLDKHFIANSREKIIEFIDRFLNDEFPTKVDDDVREKIMVNYPHASEYVLEHLLD
ncbi:MAG: hypothetical protein K6G18_01430 [Treponema sp.]|nr:hypothetical protein [Treponema sp.]